MRDHADWRDLILSYEDLEADERRRADEHLAACAECRALLDGVRAVETARGPEGALPPLEDGEFFALSADEAAAEAASRGALRARLGLEAERRAERASARGVPAGPTREAPAAARPLRERVSTLMRNLRPRVVVPLAAAAAVVLVFLLRGPETGRGPIRELRLAPYSGTRGETDSGGAPGEAGRAWRTGDAFVLRFELVEPAYPIVFHVDPDGAVALLHPADPLAPVAAMPANVSLELPPAEQDVVWTFEGEPGIETFFVAASPRAPRALDAVLDVARTAARSALGRDEVASALRAILEKRVGPVQAIEAVHAP